MDCKQALWRKNIAAVHTPQKQDFEKYLSPGPELLTADPERNRLFQLVWLEAA